MAFAFAFGSSGLLITGLTSQEKCRGALGGAVLDTRLKARPEGARDTATLPCRVSCVLSYFSLSMMEVERMLLISDFGGPR